MNHTTDTAPKRALLAAAGLAGALTLAACGSSGGSTARTAAGTAGHSSMSSDMPGMSSTGSTGSTGRAAPDAGPHTRADVTFATDMIPHHAQAVTMADMATKSATTPGVRTLAAAVRAAQAPEIATMSGWLARWNEPVPAPTSSMGSMGGMSMGGHSMRGMMSARDMMRLKDARGVDFDRMWLTMMIAHHRGAVAMATTELAAGTNPGAKALARSIIAGQSAQIRQMRLMVARLPR